MGSKKLRGWGTKFFWAQLLMGDMADNIRGLPFVVKGPTLKTIGLVGAFNMLEPCTNDKECFTLIRELFVKLGEHPGYDFVHHATQLPATATQAMFGDMQTLWMRRTKDPRDVLAWLKEEVL